MTEKWIHSMDGVPWTKAKMEEAVEILRPHAAVTFAFGAEKISVLKELDEGVFKLRPDLIFHVWSVSDKSMITVEELALLTKMRHVRKLHFSGFNNTTLQPVSEMTQLTNLQLEPNKKLDISFVEKLSLLTNISLTGSFVALEPLSTSSELTTIYLSATTNSFSFLKSLNKIEKLSIDHCMTSNDFSWFNKPSLTDLSITSIKMLENVDSIAELENLNTLKLDASKVKILPNLIGLKNLKKLELSNMKVWENPEVLMSLSKLEELQLNEINTKLKAEQFYFLAEIDTLKTLDFRFMDYNKARIEKLNTIFNEKNKDHILKK
ncbi:hypothetical protein [Flavobacterium sp. HSC-61S13]|uniref:hypothetical protein n=1 Tax=Flavobacterium sp. HSC-61S13 TaxID=2910963 RepID=UPI0020A0EF64|nr:hypothetical protein [Flavobacterium sp. HSC-61S13]MCP1996315.1 hypothetical protein [Flavobacterium sp. HSC-61S13]